MEQITLSQIYFNLYGKCLKKKQTTSHILLDVDQQDIREQVEWEESNE